jgi:hypothetical protein
MRRRRNGSAYLLVLVTSLLVATIGGAALLAARVQLRAASRGGDIESARAGARAAIDMGRFWIASDPAWRTARSAGTWTSGQSLGAGTFALEVLDPMDGTLGNNPADSVVLRGYGFTGASRQIEELTLVPRRAPLPSLAFGVLSDGTLDLNGGTLICADAPVGSNGNVVARGGATCDADAVAGATISGSIFLGSRVSAAPTSRMPDATAFDYYVANGTTISYGSTSGKIREVVLSPNSNPFNANKNPLGIYVIDCGGNTLELRDCRIVGTLVVLNCKSDSKTTGGVNLAPAVASFPSLLVRGSFRFEHDQSLLTESSGRNYNPPGTPYNGASDIDTADSYPSQVGGLVYISGDVSQKGTTAIDGQLLVRGTLQVTERVVVRYSGAASAAPPPGFFESAQMVPLGGTWARGVR